MITFDKALQQAKDYMSEQFELQKVADAGNEYWFSYFEFDDNKQLVRASFIGVDKVSGTVKDYSSADGFTVSHMRTQWNSLEKINIAEHDYIREVSVKKNNQELICDYLISEGDGLIVIKQLYKPLSRHEDILGELCQCIRQDSFEIDNPITVEGYTAKDIHERAKFMNYMGIYLFLVSLREQPEWAKEQIQKGWPRK